MINAALAFGAGSAISQQLQAIPIPKLRRAPDGSATFKLSVRVLAASVPGLAPPGVFSHTRPFLRATLGSVTKDTEFADHADDTAAGVVGVCAAECPWRFSDTLTFTAKLQDITGSGLKVTLMARKDVSLGFMQIEMRPGQVGEGVVDLRQRVLPACTPEVVKTPRDAGSPGAMTTRTGIGRARPWVSPLILVPLAHVKGGVCGAGAALGEAVAHVALIFSLDVDPDEILEACGDRPSARKKTIETAGARAQALKQEGQERVVAAATAVNGSVQAAATAVDRRVDANLDSMSRWLDSPSSIGSFVPKKVPDIPWIPDFYEPINQRVALARAQARAWSIDGTEGVKTGPELDPNGWLSHRGPDRRLYWHHRSLGPAPWEASGSGAGGSSGSRVGSPESPGPGPMADPSDDPEGWVSYRRADGRIFWHHMALGPPPWEALPVEGAEASGGGGSAPSSPTHGSDIAEECPLGFGPGAVQRSLPCVAVAPRLILRDLGENTQVAVCPAASPPRAPSGAPAAASTPTAGRPRMAVGDAASPFSATSGTSHVTSV